MATTIVSVGNNAIQISTGNIIGNRVKSNVEGFYSTNNYGFKEIVKKCVLYNDQGKGRHRLMLFGFFTEPCTATSYYGNFDINTEYDGVYTVDRTKLLWFDYDIDNAIVPTIINPTTGNALAIPYNEGDTIYNPYDIPIYNIRTQLADITTYFTTGEVIPITANGGGATHIAKRTGQLKDLSSYTSDILLVSGGGGGGLLVGETATQGQNAGGISGSGTNSGNQSTGYAFGQGESGTNVSGGGAGLYGGNKGSSSISGGAGSGYIGNSLVSNKKMVGYNVPTSSDASTKTESVSVYSSTGEADKPKAGNGKAKIKFIAQLKEYNIDELLKNKNFSDSNQYSIVSANGYSNGIGSRIPNFVGTNTILGCSTQKASNFTLPTYLNNSFDLVALNNLAYGYMCMPIIPMYVSKVSFEYKITGSGFTDEDFKALLCSDDGTSISHYDIRVAPPLSTTDWTLIEYTLSSSEFAKLYTYFTLQRNSINVKVRNIKILGVLKPTD